MTREITFDDLRSMNYLEACIKETLRFFPPAQAIGRNLIEPLTLPNGKVIPAKSSVYVPIQLIHRNPQYFPNPEAYIPERHLDQNPETRIPAYAFIPFSAGPRNCIGQRYGTIELKFVLAAIFRRYRVESLIKREECLLDVSGVIRPLSKVAVKFESRL